MQRREEGGQNPEGEGEEAPNANPLMDLRPPPLEEAGIEDCALPADSILRAFSIAAKSLASRSIAAEENEEERETRGWVDDPVEAFEEEGDAVAVEEGIPSEGERLCGKGLVEKGGGVTAGEGDEVVVDGGEGDRREGGVTAAVGGDEVVAAGEGDGKCGAFTAGKEVGKRRGGVERGEE